MSDTAMVKTAAVLTISDRSFAGERVDTGGPPLCQLLQDAGWNVIETALLPDERDGIEAALLGLCERRIALVVTTGGTGLGPRDVTPEATRAVITRDVPGLAESMRRQGEAQTPYAVLSRGVCGAREGTLIVNLPGSPKGALESLQSVLKVLSHAVEVLRSPYFNHNE